MYVLPGQGTLHAAPEEPGLGRALSKEEWEAFRAGSYGWDSLEQLLHSQTGGVFNHRDHGRLEDRPPLREAGRDLVSVVCPTSGARSQFHPFLYYCFCMQTHRPRELVVVDTGPGASPSDFFTRGPPAADPRVVYRHFDVSEGPWTIGAKRNVACYLAAGDVIVHFDDDDIYVAEYVSHMLEVLRNGTLCGEDAHVRVRRSHEGGERAYLRGEEIAAEAATLDLWHTFALASRTFAVCDPAGEDERRQFCWTFGYGFSFAYLRDTWRENPFPDRSFAEDTKFFEALLDDGVRIALIRDAVGLCAHTHHDANFSPWESDSQAALDNLAYGRELLELGSSLHSLIRHVESAEHVLKAHRSLEECLAIKDDLFDGFGSEAFQRELREAFERAGDNQRKKDAARTRLAVAAQAPFLPRYGFEGTMGGAVRSRCSWHPPATFDPEVHAKESLVQWLLNPDWQAQQPLHEVFPGCPEGDGSSEHVRRIAVLIETWAEAVRGPLRRHGTWGVR